MIDCRLTSAPPSTTNHCGDIRTVPTPTWRPGLLLALTGALVLVWPMASDAASNDDDWPDWASELDIAAQVADVNEGELAFLPAAAAATAHAHLNHIRITPDSLVGGWVRLAQCHENLDAVPAAQILFRAGGIRNLAIASSRNIGRAWVDGHSVQLQDIGRDALLCIEGESQALQELSEGHYRLRNGPYMRRFLDGYYPMRVALNIDYPADLIRLVGQSPASQPGFSVTQQGTQLSVDATFEGRLVTCFDFCAHGQDHCTEMAPDCSTD